MRENGLILFNLSIICFVLGSLFYDGWSYSIWLLAAGDILFVAFNVSNHIRIQRKRTNYRCMRLRERARGYEKVA